MSYQKQAWRDYDDTKTELQNLQNGAVVTPERMNHIETGIANSAERAELEQTKQEVTAQLAQITIMVDTSLVEEGDYTNAINEALSKVNGKAVVSFPVNSDNVLITSPLQIKEGTTLDGNNAKFNVLGNFRPFTVKGTSEDKIKNVHLKNIDVVLNGSGTNQSALYFEHAENCTYENINIDNTGLNGIEVVTSKNVHGNKGTINNSKSFGIFYYLSEDCTDSNFTVNKPRSWGHQFKSSINCKSYDIVVNEPQEEHGLYMWSGYGDGVPAVQKNEFCSYIRPKVVGSPTSKHLIYINASPNCSVIDPILIQANGGWTPISVGGTNEVEGGEIATSTGFLLTNPKIKTVRGSQTIGITGTEDYAIEFEIIGGNLKGVGNRPLYLSYAKGDINNLGIDGSSLDRESVYISNSEVNLNGLKVNSSESIGIYVANGSIVTANACEVVETEDVGVQVTSSSKLIWLGGKVENAKGGSMLLQGSDSYVGGGSRFIGGRFGADTLDGDIRITGKNNIVAGYFDKGESINLDSYIKELNGSENNKFTVENVFNPSLETDIILHASSGSTIY